MRPDVFKLEKLFAEYEHAPGMLVLGASDAASPTVQQLLDLCGSSFDLTRVRLSYSEVQGDPQLRKAIADSYPDCAVLPDQIIVTVGGSEAIFLAVHALLEAGDIALVCTPAYQALQSIAAAIPAIVELYSYTQTGQEFAPNLDQLAARLRRSPRPKLLVLNTPHNPTGHVIAERPLRDLLAVAAENDTAVLIDEVFAGVWYGSTQPVPSAITMDGNVTVIGSLSKVYALSGLRIGWLAGRRSLIERSRQLRDYTTLTPPVIVQELATIAMQNREKVLARTRGIAAQNRSHAIAWLTERTDLFDWIEPQGGLVFLVRLKLNVNTEAFVRDLAAEERVFVVPCATTFDMPEGYLRVGLGTDPTRFDEALQRIDRYLESGRWKAIEPVT
jgi:aspartate/methionine/tyrosine aminotransferase